MSQYGVCVERHEGTPKGGLLSPFLHDGRLTIASQSIQRAKDRIRRITRRNRSASFDRVIRELSPFTTGWVT